MTKKEYTDAMNSIAASDEKKKEIWGQLEQLNLQKNEVKEDFQKEKKTNGFRKKHWQVAEEEADEFCVAESLIEESRQEENKVYGTFYDKGEKVIIDGVEYQVTQVEVRDSLKGLKKKALKLVDEEICTKNGTLKKYTREKYETGDGIATPFQKVIKEEQIQPKLIYLTLQVKNTTNQKKKTVACMSMDALVWKEDSYEYVEDNYIRNIKEQIGSSIWTPVYFEGAKRIHGEGVALLAPNSTTTIHLGYLVDEDMAGNAYLNLTEAVYWDEEKDHNYSGDYIKLFEE